MTAGPIMVTGPVPAPLSSPAAYGAVAGVEVAEVLAEPQGADLVTLKRWFDAYSSAKVGEIEESRTARLYYHGSQWTKEELEKLRERGQPAITNNRISLKIDGIVGVVDRLRMDPKASPRTQQYAAGAEIGTAALREVFDANRWESLRQEVSQDLAIDGIGGAERDIETDIDGQPNIVLRRVAPETFFYDPRSVKADFSDARYMGVYKWLDLDAAIEMVPDREDDLKSAVDSGGGADTASQQDWEKNWFDTALKRVKLVEIWYRWRGDWWFALHTGHLVLKEGKSPFVDRRGKTRCRYNMASAGVDHDGDRYGFVRNMKSPQDEINHRRSKLLWILNVNQVFAEEGAVDDPNKTRRELARPDAWITYRPTTTGQKPFEIRDQAQQMQGQAELLTEAKNEIDNFGPNPALLGSGPASASGRAQALQQQAGIAQLGPYFGRYKAWKLSLYRDVWADIQQFWQDERFIRVAGPEEVQFVPVNTLVMTNEGPRLANAIGELDLDIVMDEGPDTVTVHEDVMQTLTAMIQQGLLPGPQAIAATLELSALPPSVKQKIMAAGQAPQPSPEQMQEQQAVKALEFRNAAAKVAKTEAEAERAHADAIYKQVQAQEAGDPAETQAVETADRIVDMAHKQARTRQINQQTAMASAQMGALGQMPMTAPVRF
ncbi:hypothetical protein VQ02_27485 [Methylobacterium variabile]|jgi:hypothetical protein|uniref:Portal protein n=1 Tax=Methylobacterium variabile TaxID=298794 RepID=A0A0J6SAL6_9HYPH|nr:hypothetical protein [Methylobacterium variabile]KMO30709.1 hypothetical protein VQ02_27485 [Methylobacterium variabile]